MKKRVLILGGGTINDVRPHLSLCTKAFGTTARQMYDMCLKQFPNMDVQLILTKMADYASGIISNDDVAAVVNEIVTDNTVKVVIFNIAMCDFEGDIPDSKKGRLSSNHRHKMDLYPYSEKIIRLIRAKRKDIFVIGFKTTSNATPAQQYAAGLNLLKRGSINLVIANDIGTRNNMIITPEEGMYVNGEPRTDVLKTAIEMAWHRTHLSFTRSTVVAGSPVPWHDKRVPENLRATVNWLIQQGAYKKFNGATTGHFAAKLEPNAFLTSIRKTNFNEIYDHGMVLVETVGPDNVIAYGVKPSVGGQSQRMIFDKHPELDCIIHFHCPLSMTAPDYFNISQASQWQYECGSHECGQNTAANLTEVRPGIYCVYLQNHGPNIVFSKNTPASTVIEFIADNFDLDKPTHGFTQVYL